MKISRLVLGAALALAAVGAAPAGPSDGGADAATIIARCAAAMGGEALIKSVRSVRLEVVYPDHDATAVIRW